MFGRCTFDPPAGQVRRQRKTGGEAQEPVAVEAEEALAAPVPAPLDMMEVLFPVLHCLGSAPAGGAPRWAALGCASAALRAALREACRENPVLLHEWRGLGQRAAGAAPPVLREDFRSAERWRRHDVKGKVHELMPTIVRPRCSTLGAPCHVLFLSPVRPPEEFVLDMERHRQLSRVEFSWCAEVDASATLQLCKYLKQREAAPPVACVELAAQPGSGGGWCCVRLELDWARRVYRWSLEAGGGASAVAAPAEQAFGHEACDGVRYLKVADLTGNVALAHLQAFA